MLLLLLLPPRLRHAGFTDQQLVLRFRGQCLDVAGGSFDANTPLRLGACSGTASQHWHVELPPGNSGNGSYAIPVRFRAAAGDMCLDAPGAGADSRGVAVVLQPCSWTASSQQWMWGFPKLAAYSRGEFVNCAASQWLSVDGDRVVLMSLSAPPMWALARR